MKYYTMNKLLAEITGNLAPQKLKYTLLINRNGLWQILFF